YQLVRSDPRHAISRRQCRGWGTRRVVFLFLIKPASPVSFCRTPSKSPAKLQNRGANSEDPTSRRVPPVAVKASARLRVEDHITGRMATCRDVQIRHVDCTNVNSNFRRPCSL